MVRKKKRRLPRKSTTEWMIQNTSTIEELVSTCRRDYDALIDMVEIELRDELRVQLKEATRRALAVEISRATGADPLDIAVLLEEFDQALDLVLA